MVWSFSSPLYTFVHCLINHQRTIIDKLHGVSVYYLPHNLQYYIIPYIKITGTHIDIHKEEHII